MKYINANRLRAEIEELKRKEGFCSNDADTVTSCIARGIRRACNHIDTNILFLQQEQPEVDLEKESLKYFIEIRVKDDETPILCDFKFKVNFATIARHFFELGLNARKEEQL